MRRPRCIEAPEEDPTAKYYRGWSPPDNPVLYALQRARRILTEVRKKQHRCEFIVCLCEVGIVSICACHSFAVRQERMGARNVLALQRVRTSAADASRRQRRLERLRAFIDAGPTEHF